MGAKTNALKVTLPSDTQILLTREFNAPRHLVWEAMTKPELVKQWWGPRGTELSVCEIDLRPGGAWRFVSRGPDGIEHPFKGVYKEIAAPERIVQTWVYDVPPFNEFESVETATLEERDGRTTLETLVQHKTKEARDGHVGSGMEKGAGETMDRLEELLAKKIA
jgi:uncharacterized protein YndB with AHSA1/START domain